MAKRWANNHWHQIPSQVLLQNVTPCVAGLPNMADVHLFAVVQLTMEQLKDQILTQLFAGMPAVFAWLLPI